MQSGPQRIQITRNWFLFVLEPFRDPKTIKTHFPLRKALEIKNIALKQSIASYISLYFAREKAFKTALEIKQSS